MGPDDGHPVAGFSRPAFGLVRLPAGPVPGAARSLTLELGFTSGQAETLFQLALEKVKSIQSLDAYEMGLWALARDLPAAFEQRFLDLALALPPDEWRSRILERLAPGLSRDALTRTAEACTTLQEDHLAKMRFYAGIALQTRSSDLRRGPLIDTSTCKGVAS